MPVALKGVPSADIAEAPPRKRWTRAEMEVLESTGAFVNQHLELIEGELINKMGKKRPHSNSLVLLQAWLVAVFSVRFVNPETSIDVRPEDNPTSEPEPDLIVLKSDLASYQKNPRPQDLRLVVEVSDTTLDYDLSVKAALYARAEIVEYWVVDIQNRRLIVHRNPEAGHYESIEAYSQNEAVSPLAAPQASLKVADVFAY